MSATPGDDPAASAFLLEHDGEAFLPENDADAFLRRALDPAHSVVVDACAGSGKTWLLVARIVRLLLAGVEPSAILAITFTRKGAQEMRARLNDSLRLLATAPETTVIEFLRQRGVSDAQMAESVRRSRGLFEACLAVRPGVTIDTFHGWFLQLLERAPFNASAQAVSADFTLDERSSFLVDEAWDLFGAVLQQAANRELAAGFASLAGEMGYRNLRNLLGRFLQNARSGGPTPATRRIRSRSRWPSCGQRWGLIRRSIRNAR